jgi:hypothetical protein
MAESASMKTTPTASDSELGGPGYIDDDDYKPDQVTINTQRFLNYNRWFIGKVGLLVSQKGGKLLYFV